MIENWPFRILIVVATVAAMEPLVALTHRYVMHGFGWAWHRDHHEPGHKHLERNDLYAVVGAAIAITTFAVSWTIDYWLFWVAIGITVYGILYSLLHDGLIHRRYDIGWQPRSGYFKRLVDAHHLHHVVRGKEDGVSFGFLYARPVDKLRAELKRQANRRAARGTGEPSGSDRFAAGPNP